jgi:hypothetical protein
MRRRVRVGAPDPSLTPVSGMVAMAELVERLDVIGRLDAVIGRIKQRRRGRTAGGLLVGIAAAQLAGEDFLVGLDRQRADTAGQQHPGRRSPRPHHGAAVVGMVAAQNSFRTAFFALACAYLIAAFVTPRAGPRSSG